MQSWHDQGYFTPDLLMKRTQVDTEWISVGELTRRAAGPKIFLSPVIGPVPPGPPGLTRRLESPSDPLLHQRDVNPFPAPHQPVPIRSLRTSTLDSYINGNSQSASPSSSADPASHVFGNSEPPINAIGTNRRPCINPSVDGLGRSPYSNTAVTYGFNGKFLLPVGEVIDPDHSSKIFTARVFPGIICNRQLQISYLAPALHLIDLAAAPVHTNPNSAFPPALLLVTTPFYLQPPRYNSIKTTSRTSCNLHLHRYPTCLPITTLLPLHLGGHPIYR